ncbi:MAG: rubrerythrin [Oscillospiraceae bacterium]|nr:rubrerythrin [Oscillospiraceae bacterium]
MTRKQLKNLRRAQQGELDAVLMYNALADTVTDPADAETFRKLAAEEGRHGSVFFRYTEQIVKPRRTKAVLLPFLYRVLGRKITYRLIAKGEYDAARVYEHLIPAFPEVESIRADEQRHGDTVKALLARHVPVKKRIVRAIILTTGLLALAGCVYFTLSHRRHSRR